MFGAHFKPEATHNHVVGEEENGKFAIIRDINGRFLSCHWNTSIGLRHE